MTEYTTTITIETDEWVNPDAIQDMICDALKEDRSIYEIADNDYHIMIENFVVDYAEEGE